MDPAVTGPVHWLLRWDRVVGTAEVGAGSSTTSRRHICRPTFPCPPRSPLRLVLEP